MSAIDEQRAYYDLCDEARALGIPTSLDDPDSPRTVAELRDLVASRRVDVVYTVATNRQRVADFKVDDLRPELRFAGREPSNPSRVTDLPS